MTKKDGKLEDRMNEDALRAQPAETPGILVSSMTELRGFRLGPSGTALGIGGPRPVPPPTDEARVSQPDPDTFARLQAMVGRLDEAPRVARVDEAPRVARVDEAPRVARVDEPPRVGPVDESPRPVTSSEAPATRSPVEAPSGTALTREATGSENVVAEQAPRTFRRPTPPKSALVGIVLAFAIVVVAALLGRRPAPQEQQGATAPVPTSPVAPLAPVPPQAPEPPQVPPVIPVPALAAPPQPPSPERSGSKPHTASAAVALPANASKAAKIEAAPPSAQVAPQPPPPDVERVGNVPFNARPSNPPE